MSKGIYDRLNTAGGKVGFYYKNLVTNKVMEYNADETFYAASVIKFPILAEISRQASFGTIDMHEKITVKNSDKMPSCGALNSFTNEPVVDILTLCKLMITISDNTATNMLIKRFGIETLNAGFEEIGLKKTMLRRLLFDKKAVKEGKENVFVPREIGGLFESIYSRTFVNEAVSKEIESILLEQQINHKIPGRYCDRIRVAHKTGEDDGITNDVGIVYDKEPFILVFASNDTNVPEFEQTIRDISFELSSLNE